MSKYRKSKSNRNRRRRHLAIEKLQSRQLMAADTIGVTHLDTGEFLLGSIAVTPVFLESNGETDAESQNWSASEIQETLDKIRDSVDWWSDALDTFDSVHTLDFVIDETFARTPVETPYEPIDRNSEDFSDNIEDFLITEQINAVSIEDGMRQFNNAQRTKHGTDWAFTIFVADSSDDGDGFFASGGNFRGAFAYPGGQYIVSPSQRPTSTFSHEIGHIFWALDEYSGGASYDRQRGYYNTPNTNAAGNPTPGFVQQPSIMASGLLLNRAFENHVSPASTFAMLGWQDSDDDGVFDVLDVPLDLTLTGHYDADAMTYHVQGSASAVPLRNQNTSGPQSDITLNRISRLEYRLNGGPWQTAASPDQPKSTFNLSIDTGGSFNSIEFQVIDAATGITSEVISADSLTPLLPTTSATGYAFLDVNQDGQRQADESLLGEIDVSISRSDGSDVLASALDASLLEQGEIDPANYTDITLSADGHVLDTIVGADVLSSQDNRTVFRAFDIQRGRWQSYWSESRQFVADFASPVGDVTIDAIGFTTNNYARIEAYDAQGVLIRRVTSDAFERDETQQISVSDSLGRIASVRVFGHASTRIAINRVEVSPTLAQSTTENGVWFFENLADGNYAVTLTPQSIFHRVESSPLQIQVIGGTVNTAGVAVTQANSLFQNPTDPHDVNNDGRVTPLDALLIINDIDRYSIRELTRSDATELFVDVSNDGSVLPIDALLVINRISNDNAEIGQSEQAGAVASATRSTSAQQINQASQSPSPHAKLPADARQDSQNAAAMDTPDFEIDSDGALDQKLASGFGAGDSPTPTSTDFAIIDLFCLGNDEDSHNPFDSQLISSLARSNQL